MDELDIKTHGAGLTVRVHVKPRARKSAILGIRAGALEVQVAAPPVDGEANAELVTTLARACRLPKASVSIVSGASTRSKIVRLEGLDVAELERRLLENPSKQKK